MEIHKKNFDELCELGKLFLNKKNYEESKKEDRQRLANMTERERELAFQKK